MTGTAQFTMTRSFPAPRSKVWRAWSEADQLQHWWGPQGCTITVERLEFRPGGFFHYAMTFPGMSPSWGRFCYRDIAAPDRIIWLNSFANADCGIARAPFSDICPMEIENTVAFTETAGITTISLQAAAFGATAAEQGFFAELCSTGSLDQGYGGTMDQLARHLQG